MGRVRKFAGELSTAWAEVVRAMGILNLRNIVSLECLRIIRQDTSTTS
jgi:hypothetical protein